MKGLCYYLLQQLPAMRLVFITRPTANLRCRIAHSVRRLKRGVVTGSGPDCRWAPRLCLGIAVSVMGGGRRPA